MGDLEDIRSNIDAIDEKILMFLNKRAEYALKIGTIKKAENLAIYNPGREKKILESITSMNKGPLNTEQIKKIFQCIIEACRNLELDE
jgi:chorismate mutase-like protein